MSEPTDDEIEAAYVIAETTLDPTTPLADVRASFHRWLDQVRAEERERIAKAIEDLLGAGNAFRDQVLGRAARVAREAGRQ